MLARRCCNCHGPKPESREAEMCLDVRDSALGVRDGEYAVIAPGNVGDDRRDKSYTTANSPSVRV